MSYSRGRYYIWPDDAGVNFGADRVPNDMLNVFLYKILLANRREELAGRLRDGRRIVHAEAEASDFLRSIEYGKRLDALEDELVGGLLRRAEGGAPSC